MEEAGFDKSQNVSSLLLHELLAQTEALGGQGTELVMTGGHILNTGRRRDEAFPGLDPHGQALIQIQESLPAEKDRPHWA